jgi:hypothetical protein
MMDCYKRVLINGTWWINIQTICDHLHISVDDQINWLITKKIEVKSIFGQMHIQEMYSVGWIITLTNTEGANVDDVMNIHSMIYKNLNQIPC